MEISPIITRDDGKTVDVKLEFWENDKHLHTLTVGVDNPDKYDGSTGIILGALRKSHEVFPQLQEAITEALKPENDPRAPAKKP